MRLTPQQIDQIDHFDREPTGVAHCWNADVVATAKRDLVPGEVLDGEGGYTVWGKLLPAKRSVAIGGLPLGLAHGVKLLRPVAQPSLELGRRGNGHRQQRVQHPAGDGGNVSRRGIEAECSVAWTMQ